MQFLSPIWFTALTAIIIPVVIHLWNIRPGKTLKVGSISLFEEASPASSRSFQLLDILLLILRCLLLALIAFLLAAPFWQHQLNGKAKGWVLLPSSGFNQTYKRYQKTIDSLVLQGYECHLAPGFEKLDLQKKPLKVPGDTTGVGVLNYWSLLSPLAKQIPASMPVEIFTPNTAKHFGGSKPATALNLHWHTYVPADSVKSWPAKAWFTSAGIIRVVQAVSKPSGISYGYTEMQTDQANALYNVASINGSMQLSMKNDTSAKTVIDTSVNRIAIYAPGNEADAGYLKAALDAASKFAEQQTRITVYHQTEAIPAGSSWLFWLSDKPVPDALMHSSRQVLYYVSGKAEESNTWISNSPDRNVTGPALAKYIPGDSTTENIWTDGFGRTFLGKKMQGSTTIYPFHSHFNPSWNDLVWNDAFPMWMLQLNSPGLKISPQYDTRTLSDEQLQLLHIATASGAFHPQRNNTDLSLYLWLALTIIFFAERWLAHQNKPQITNG